MRHYGANKYRSYDTDPQIKSARAYAGRVADEDIAQGLEDHELRTRPCGIPNCPECSGR